MKKIKIYRVEIWAQTSHTNWESVALSEFYANHSVIDEKLSELFNIYNEMDARHCGKFGTETYESGTDALLKEWYEYLSKISDENITDTHGNMPEIVEYIVNL